MPPRERQILEMLLRVQRGELAPEQACRELGVSPRTYYRYHMKYRGDLEAEIARLRAEDDRRLDVLSSALRRK